MSGDNSMRVRPSALLPFVLSALSFALVILLALSGTNPTSSQDGYLFSFNTTDVGKRLIEFSPAPATTSATVAARNIHSNPGRSIIADPVAKNSTNSESPVSSSPNTNLTIAAAADPNAASASTSATTSASTAAPMLAIPQTAGVVNPAAIPIGIVAAAFQLLLNTFASGTGAALQTIITTLVATQKQTMGVSPIYSFHTSGICFGSSNATTTNSSLPFNVTRCVSYYDTGDYIVNSTKDVPDFALIAATNVTIPLLSKIPSLGESGKSLIDKISTIVLAGFIVALIGNGLSFLLSIAAFLLPSNGKIHAAGAIITTLSSQILQITALTSSFVAGGITSGVNGSSELSGLSASSGGKFLAFIWIGYISAQIANLYWVLTWFVKFRTTANKKRARTPQQMQAGYRGIVKEVLSDYKLKKTDYEDTEVLVSRPVDVKHWDDSYKQM